MALSLQHEWVKRGLKRWARVRVHTRHRALTETVTNVCSVFILQQDCRPLQNILVNIYFWLNMPYGCFAHSALFIKQNRSRTTLFPLQYLRSNTKPPNSFWLNYPTRKHKITIQLTYLVTINLTSHACMHPAFRKYNREGEGCGVGPEWLFRMSIMALVDIITEPTHRQQDSKINNAIIYHRVYSQRQQDTKGHNRATID